MEHAFVQPNTQPATRLRSPHRHPDPPPPHNTVRVSAASGPGDTHDDGDDIDDGDADDDDAYDDDDGGDDNDDTEERRQPP